MQPRLTRVDELLAGEHHWLTGSEPCYFLREYTRGVGFAASDTNNLVNNLKKPPRVRGTPQWRYKGLAIAQVARELRATLDPGWLTEATVVPMPPSKVPGDPDHDDRMLRILRWMTTAGRPRLRLDIRPLLRQRESVEAAHQGGPRLGPDQLEDLLEVDEEHAEPAPTTIAVLDDVLTTGAHFVAAERVLRERFGDVTVVGLSVARVVHRED